MGMLSAALTQIVFGTTGSLSLSRCTINSTTGEHANVNLDVMPGAGTNYGLYTTADIKAARVWNAVWNDLADYQLLCDELVFGKCYFDTKDGAKICNQRCQMSVIGIASDTFGLGIGSGNTGTSKEVPIAVAGWVLAHVDKEYECGTPLTNDEFGNLTAMTRNEKLEYPERIVALYKRPELDSKWGPEGQKIDVNGRHWVKVK